MGYFKKELEERFKESIKKDWEVSGNGLVEKQFRKFNPRSDNAYLNQLKIDQDIFKGLLPELTKNLE